MAGIESIWGAIERLECEVFELRDLVQAHREVGVQVGGEQWVEPA